MTLRVLLVDDHAILRAGLRALLSELGDVEIVGEAANGHDALALIDETRPDVALVDISMPGLNGLETACRLAKQHSSTRVIILTMHADEEYVRQAFAMGAAGYVLKNADRAELELALRSVARGETWISPAMSRPVVDAYAAHGAPAEAGVFAVLTSRQREILQLIAEGHSTKSIAAKLELSIKTVETHRARIMARLGVRTLQALVKYAIRTGLVDTSS
jgi:DNA-binding NarL/FixJ family response regulator